MNKEQKEFIVNLIALTKEGKIEWDNRSENPYKFSLRKDKAFPSIYKEGDRVPSLDLNDNSNQILFMDIEKLSYSIERGFRFVVKRGFNCLISDLIATVCVCDTIKLEGQPEYECYQLLRELHIAAKDFIDNKAHTPSLNDITKILNAY